MTKYRFYCSDCGVEAIIEITEGGDYADEVEVGCCFNCGNDGIEAEEIEEV